MDEPLLKKTGDPIQEALSISTFLDPGFNKVLRMDYLFVPVTPQMVAAIKAAADREVGATLELFLEMNTQRIFSQRTISDFELVGLHPENAAEVKGYIIEASIDALLAELKKSLMGAARKFQEEGGL